MTALHDASDRFRSQDSVRGVVEEDPDLQDRYGEYRRRQAAALLSLLPREGVRPLYARAREWARGAGIATGKDPLATLVLYLQEILPLPPFQVWLADRDRNLDAHLREEFDSAQAHRREAAPVTVESRGMELEGRRWQATLNLFRRDEAWRGFIAFRPLAGPGGVRTADIFREDDPEEIRERFLSFHPQTLQAFLRSVLP